MKFKSRREALIWAAGVYEGEGCLSRLMHKRNYGKKIYHYWQASTVSTDKDTVETFHSAVGVGRVYYLGEPRGPRGKKVTWTWSCTKREEIYFIMAQIYPFLCSRRQEKVREFVKEFSHV